MSCSPRSTVALVAVAIATAVPAWGQTAELDSSQIERKLSQFDPAAVAAARSYARNFDFKGQLEKALPIVKENVIRLVKAKNPTLNEAVVGEFFDVFYQKAFVENSGSFENINLVMILEIFSKDELAAVDKFYSSEIGKSILRKTPQMMGRMTELSALLQNKVFPDALRAAQEQLKKKGVEVRI